jgi:DNA-binding NarL/FixJ family response regulator
MAQERNPENPIRILIADELVLYRRSLQTILLEEKFYLTRSFGTIDEFKSLSFDSNQLPDIAIISHFIAERDSLRRAKWLNDRFPEIKIILMITLDDGKFSLKYLRRPFINALLIRSLFEPEAIVGLVRLVDCGFTCFPKSNLASAYLPNTGEERRDNL